MKPCANQKCGKPFRPLKPWGKYCSRECGDAARHRAYYQRERNRCACGHDFALHAHVEGKGNGYGACSGCRCKAFAN